MLLPVAPANAPVPPVTTNLSVRTTRVTHVIGSAQFAKLDLVATSDDHRRVRAVLTYLNPTG